MRVCTSVCMSKKQEKIKIIFNMKHIKLELLTNASNRCSIHPHESVPMPPHMPAYRTYAGL